VFFTNFLLALRTSEHVLLLKFLKSF